MNQQATFQESSFAKRVSKTLKDFGSSFANVNFSSLLSKSKALKASRKSYDHVTGDFDIERGRFNSEDFEEQLQSIHPLEVINRKGTIEFKELIEESLARKKEDADKTKSKGIMKSIGNMTERQFRKFIKEEKITGSIKIVALDIGTNNIGASVLEVDLETLRRRATADKLIDMEQHILAGFGRTENKDC